MSDDTIKGIFVTTSAFDRKAVDKAKYAHHKIVLIDGRRLAELPYNHDNHGVGVQVRTS
ncbi:MAG: restriction endonuclease [Coraliomargaritaceae bacterium]